jgi:hypothetical protein
MMHLTQGSGHGDGVVRVWPPAIFFAHRHEARARNGANRDDISGRVPGGELREEVRADTVFNVDFVPGVA